MSTSKLPEPYASILASYMTAMDLSEIAKRHGLTLMGLVEALQSEPLAGALAEIEEETRRRNYLHYAQTALRVLAQIAATSPDPKERRRAASEILKFLTPVCKIAGSKASVLIVTRPLTATSEPCE
jgi:hypothetical protein